MILKFLLAWLIGAGIRVLDICRSVPEPDVLDIKALLYFSIKRYPEVTDAGIEASGRTISLALVVRHSADQERARELGEGFVRMTKVLLFDGKLGLLPGRGTYSYLVTVCRPDETVVARGAKHWRSDRMRW